LKLVNFSHFLLEDLLVIDQVIGQCYFVPFVAHPTLCGVSPEGTLFYLFLSKHSREDDLVHVTYHWILEQKVVSHLVDAHEHQS